MSPRASRLREPMVPGVLFTLLVVGSAFNPLRWREIIDAGLTNEQLVLTALHGVANAFAVVLPIAVALLAVTLAWTKRPTRIAVAAAVVALHAGCRWFAVPLLAERLSELAEASSRGVVWPAASRATAAEHLRAVLAGSPSAAIASQALVQHGVLLACVVLPLLPLLGRVERKPRWWLGPLLAGGSLALTLGGTWLLVASPHVVAQLAPVLPAALVALVLAHAIGMPAARRRPLRAAAWSLVVAATLAILASPLAFPAPGATFAVGRAAPAAAVLSTDAGETSLAGLRGRVTILAFWATWCGPCRSELPHLERLQARHGHESLAVVPVHVRSDPSEARTVMAELAPTLTTHGWAGPLAIGPGVPVTVVLDATGTVRAVQTGYTDESAARLELLVAQLLEAR